MSIFQGNHTQKKYINIIFKSMCRYYKYSYPKINCVFSSV
jgi:hypothetical protein